MTNFEKMMGSSNEISLDDILDMARKISAEQKRKSNLEQFQQIIEGVARKYKSIWVDRADLEQELWVTVLEKIEEFGGAENLDAPFIAKCCYNRAVDYYRYNRRRADSKARLIEEMESDDDNSSEAELMHSNFDNGMDRVVIKEVVDLFPLQSRERKYVVTKLYMFGLISEADRLPDKLEMPEDDTESGVLKLLGYKSRYPQSWGKMKYQIRDTIYRYLGMIPDGEVDEASVKATMLSRVEEMVLTSRKGYVDFKRILRDKALILLGLDQDTLLELLEESSRVLKSVGPGGDWWALKNDQTVIQDSFIAYGYKVFEK